MNEKLEVKESRVEEQRRSLRLRRRRRRIGMRRRRKRMPKRSILRMRRSTWRKIMRLRSMMRRSRLSSGSMSYMDGSTIIIY